MSRRSRMAVDGSEEEEEEEDHATASTSPKPEKKQDKEKKVEDENAVKYHCDYCRKDISDGIRIKCAECTDFDLCVQCFSVGVQVTPHRNTHNYQVMDRVNFPLFDENWEAEEELLLLEAIAKYGLGNWEDIADHVGTKTLQECSEHYFSTYIDVPTAPLPSLDNILTSADTLKDRKRESDQRQASSNPRRKRQKKTAKRDNVQSTKTIPGQRPIGVVGGAASSAAAGGDYASAPVSLEQAGFMPLRREFEVEYHNNAEANVSPIVFEDDDTEEETEAKYRILEIYNRKLYERYLKRELVISRDLMNIKRLQSRERDLQVEDRELYGRLRVFVQVLSRDDFDTFVDGLVAERRLRRRIESLQRWRSAGCRTLAAGERFAAERRRRQAEASAARRARFDAAAAAATAAANERRRRLEALAKWNHKVPKARKTTPLMVEGLPAADLLSERERNICSRLRIYPKQYMLAKEKILQLAMMTKGSLQKNIVRNHVRMDVHAINSIFDFMCESGWIK